MIEKGQIRGCFVRIDDVMRDLVGRRSYPPEVASLVAESLSLCCVLSSSLKYHGTFTLQAQGEGPVSLIVADITHQKTVRAYAKYEPEKLAALPKKDMRDLLGMGHLAFTVDHADAPNRYAGVIELEGHTLTEVAQNYFRQSEQIETAIKTVSGPLFASSLMIQRMPSEVDPEHEVYTEEEDDAWRTAVIMLGSLKDAEMRDDGLAPEKLLHRLYHSSVLEVFPPQEIKFACRCSYERIHGAIQTLPEPERITLLKDGKINVTCEFCGKKYEIVDA